MTSWPILSILLILPLVGALFIALLPEDAAGVRNARWMALWTTAITFIVSLILIWRFDPASADFQFVEKRPWDELYAEAQKRFPEATEKNWRDAVFIVTHPIWIY